MTADKQFSIAFVAFVLALALVQHYEHRRPAFQLTKTIVRKAVCNGDDRRELRLFADDGTYLQVDGRLFVATREGDRIAGDWQ